MTIAYDGNEYHRRERHDIIPLVPPCERLLDVGGGEGATAAKLKQIGRCKVAGVVDQVARIENQTLDFSVQADLRAFGSVAQVAKKYGPFDVILCLDVLEHLPEPEALIPEIVDVLSPGGIVVASIPNVRHISVVGPLVFKGQWTYADEGILDRTHLRFFVRDSAVKLLRDAGLQIESVQRSGFGKKRYRLLNALTLGLLRDMFAIQYYITARKAA